MIHYHLRCSRSHDFDGWFNDSSSFEKQAKLGLIECPECGGTEVERALMTPAVAKRDTRETLPVPVEPPQAPAPVPAPAMAAAGRVPAQMVAMLQRIRAEVEKNCEYVGSEFADRARAMHRGETEAKGIYGEASEEQAEGLADEGIDVARIPWIPRADG